MKVDWELKVCPGLLVVSFWQWEVMIRCCGFWIT